MPSTCSTDLPLVSPLAVGDCSAVCAVAGESGGEGVTSSGVAGNDGQSAGGKLEGGSAN